MIDLLGVGIRAIHFRSSIVIVCSHSNVCAVYIELVHNRGQVKVANGNSLPRSFSLTVTLNVLSNALQRREHT